MEASEKTQLARTDSRVLLWGAIFIYTLLLPNAIVVYRMLVDYIGKDSTGNIPLISVILIGGAYALYGYRKNRNFKFLLYLIPAGIIALLIMRLEENPNKHIHIPEYVLMAWLLYAVLSKDYRGSGIFVLVFLCGSLLGVVDELEQGIYPRRFYGWSDMLVNSASILIGIFTLKGVTPSIERDWRWRSFLRSYQPELGVLIFGFLVAVFMGAQLFYVQMYDVFWGAYPRWLLGCNILFLVALFVVIGWRWRQVWGKPPAAPEIATQRGVAITIRLWLYPLLTIIGFMHLLVLFVAFSGVSFR